MTILASLFREGAVTIEARPCLVDDQLLPEEWAYINRALPVRRAEFGTARLCARRALAEMGYPPVPLVPRPDRAPVWPTGVVGSIAHTRDYCVVVLERSPPLRSLGVDAEVVGQLDGSMIALIATAAERRWLQSLRGARVDDFASLLFSAKEAYYKCQYPISGTVLDFQDVEIEVDQGNQRFEARVRKVDFPESVARVEGRFAFDRGMILCGVELLP